jgi:hypothetical protein
MLSLSDPEHTICVGQNIIPLHTVKVFVHEHMGLGLH